MTGRGTRIGDVDGIRGGDGKQKGSVANVGRRGGSVRWSELREEGGEKV